ncbi:hypothetical protein GCM10010218_42000 [Streptomyces mashuensis]|uniref:DUF3558 domain-containing protein n=1 Tax=Streptomyces mashuensis TaxID=33904 RepID=A0A919B545_9ACTN|nr:hypothetical protein [Streptomyces mashuensis]GHF56271.1 hypothetical protein GCM10010218_42000 [Streptomyces mashuensis]
MQRRAYAPAAALAAAVLSAGLTACDAGSATTGGNDAKPGLTGASAPAPQPGKYHSLPEPCGYVSRDTVRRMLPGADENGEEEATRILRGQATLTYDTDRRVGCRWKLETPTGSRHLSVDFERVVSYQPGVSDEKRAEQLYQRMATAAHIPAASPSPSPTPSPSGSGNSGSPSPGASQSPGPGPQLGDASVAPSVPPSAPATDPRLAPRTLDDLGDDAYVDDRLVTTGSGVHRDVTVVFRSANVLVTVAYDQWSSDPHHVPTSQDLQGRAQALARELDAGHFGN